MADDLLLELAGLSRALRMAADVERSKWAPEPPPRTVLAGSLAEALAAASLDGETLK